MSDAISAVQTATAPSLIGSWVFDPTAPGSTERNYLHTDGRAETLAPASQTINIAGRVNPLIEFGESVVLGLTVNVTVPFGSDHDAAVQWWRDAELNRRAICYRDNRGRLIWAGLPDGVEFADVREGTNIKVKLQRVDYNESVV